MKTGFEQLLGYRDPADDPRLYAVDGDEIDELVNEQLSRGRKNQT